MDESGPYQISNESGSTTIYILHAIELVTKKTFFIPLQSTRTQHIIMALDILRNRRGPINTTILDDHPSHRPFATNSPETKGPRPYTGIQAKGKILTQSHKTPLVNTGIKACIMSAN